MSSVSSRQRFNRRNLCPICEGGDHDKRGRGERCAGYLSDDGRYAFCTREQYAGNLQLDERTSPASYRHRLDGTCNCGVEHGVPLAPIQRPATPPKPPKQQRGPYPKMLDGATLTTVYTYQQADGNRAYSVLRYEYPLEPGQAKPNKTFRQVTHLDGDTWAWGLGEAERVLYRLPDLLAASPFRRRLVFIAEGEKAAEALIALGLIATTCSEGAEKWRQVPGRHDALRNQHIVVLADNDEAGRRHAEQVAADLEGVAMDVRILTLPGVPEHGDAVEWIANGGTKDELYELVIDTPPEDVAPVQLDAPATYHAVLTAREEALKAANVQMNQRLHLVQQTVTAAHMKPSARVALLAVRREIERNTHQLDADGFLTIYKPHELARNAGLSKGTLLKEINEYASAGVLRKKHVPTPNGNKLVAVGFGPLIDTPWEAPVSEKAPHGGKRAGAGRPKKCPECGSTNIRVTKKTVLVIRCRNYACGTVTEKILGEQEVTNLDDAWAERTENQDEFHPPEEADSHLETHDTSPPVYVTTIKMNVTPTPEAIDDALAGPPCPTCGGATRKSPIAGYMVCPKCCVLIAAEEGDAA